VLATWISVSPARAGDVRMVCPGTDCVLEGVAVSEGVSVGVGVSVGLGAGVAD